MFKKILFSILFLIQITNSFAASKSDCSNIDKNLYADEYHFCIRGEIAAKAAAAGVDCIDCLMQEEQKQPPGWLQALSVLAAPISYLGGAYITAKYQYQSQQAMADAYSSGYQQCTNRFNSYLNYSTQVGANPITTNDAQTLMNTCNGSSYGNYSGMSGFQGNGYNGYGNPVLSAGYSPNFMGGMVGPYYGGVNANIYGGGMGYSAYSNMNTGMYGGAGMGMYGNIGMGMPQNTMAYNANYSGLQYGNMNMAGMGINANTYGSGYSFGAAPYAAANLTGSIGISGGISGGFKF
jgi:hypothetical protein